jgi:shikimate dehydrogenase
MSEWKLQPELLQYERLFGLIGYPLSHSFSKKYFSEKFEREGINDAFYELFPIEKIELFPGLIQNYPNLQGLNVTIPYKEAVMPYLDELEESARAIGAVNTINIADGKTKGFNTDVFGFEQSLRAFFAKNNAQPDKALVLGTGGAAKAVQFVLEEMGMAHQTVSRQASKGDLTYHDLDEAILQEHRLIVNTTPLGMSPNIGSFPNIPYHCIGKKHMLYDLVYNPEMTAFLQKGKARGAATENGLAMLYGQAERAWAIWNDHSPAVATKLT